MLNSKRIHLLDEIRGTAVICMVFYHATFTMSEFFSLKTGSEIVSSLLPLQPVGAGIFIFISGICANLTESNLKRGIKLFIIALAISLITYTAFPEQVIVFGILHMLSVSMILFAVLQRFIKKIPMWAGASLSVILFILTCSFEKGYISMFSIKLFSLPEFLYRYRFLFPVGIHLSSFFSSDYFPLFPWFFLFLCGAFIGRLTKKHNIPSFIYKKHSGFLSFIGRKALWIYLLHQPVIFGILFIVEEFLQK